jgi:hypothetical protein
MLLNGSDQITFGNSPSLNPGKTITVEAWVRPKRVPTSPGSAWQLVSIYNNALLYLRGGPRPKFEFSLFDAAHSSYAPSTRGTSLVKAGNTYHVVGTYDGKRIRIYVDGKLESSTRYDKPLNAAGFGGAIAYPGWGDLPTPHFDGNIDEVAIYSHALTAKRVQAHYRRGSGA